MLTYRQSHSLAFTLEQCHNMPNILVSDTFKSQVQKHKIYTSETIVAVQLYFWGIILTHWGRVTHICVCKLTIIGSDNGLSPDRRQAIIWTNAGILLIGPLGTNFSEFLIKILTFSFKKMRLKVSSAKSRPFCLGLNELTHLGLNKMVDILYTTLSNVFFSFFLFIWVENDWTEFLRTRLPIS